MSKEIVRIWIYEEVENKLKFPDCTISKTNKPVRSVKRGDFIYYQIDNNKVSVANRKDAWWHKRRTRRKIKTFRGYPAWLRDLGVPA